MALEDGAYLVLEMEAAWGKNEASACWWMQIGEGGV